jgi:hypothetical protein
MINAELAGGRCDGKRVRVDGHTTVWLEAEPVVVTVADLLVEDQDPSRPPEMPVLTYRWDGETRADGTRIFRLVRPA